MLRNIRLLILFAAAAPLAAQRGLPGESVKFSGSLVAITPHSVWVKQANDALRFAGLPRKGSIAAASLTAKYKFGDQVSIKGVIVAGFRDDEDGDWRQLEAKAVDYLRPPSAAELAHALASPVAQKPGNLLQVPPAVPGAAMTEPVKTEHVDGDAAAALERTRNLLRKYLAALPNFNADESAIMYHSPVSASPKWQAFETLESEVSFQGATDAHRNVVRNGAPWTDPFDHLPPAPRAGQQHTLLRSMFDAKCASLEFKKRQVELGIPVLVFGISVPPEGCIGGGWGEPGERYYPGWTGEVTVAEADGLVRRLETASAGYPKGFLTQQDETRAIWDYIKIGDERYLLPVEVQASQIKTGVEMWSVRKFRNHRHFEAFSNLTYK